jgi:hypothetical protein
MPGQTLFNALRPTGASRYFGGPVTPLTLHHFINWSQQLPKARKQIFPRLAMRYQRVPASHRGKGYQSLAGGQVFFPTLFPNLDILLFSSFVPVPPDPPTPPPPATEMVCVGHTALVAQKLPPARDWYLSRRRNQRAMPVGWL